jgi:hypothetical protein
VTDMYRGLVQHAAYITPYLRDQTINRKLVQPVTGDGSGGLYRKIGCHRSQKNFLMPLRKN